MASKDPDKKGWLTRQREKVTEKSENALDRARYEASKKYHRRWMIISGCNHPNMIDYSIPQIELEYALCDMVNIKLIRKGKRREEFLAQLSPEAQGLYLNAVDEDGNRYTDLENPHVLRSLIAGIKQAWREKRGVLTPDEENALNGLLDVSEDEIEDEDGE